MKALNEHSQLVRLRRLRLLKAINKAIGSQMRPGLLKIRQHAEIVLQMRTIE